MAQAGQLVYVIDEIELRPGALEPFLATLEADYEPGARARGMRRRHTWVAPPFELEAGGTQLLVVWEVEGAEGFWRSRSSAPEVLDWWKDCERFIASRTRRYAAEHAALGALDAAGRVNA